VIWQRAVSADLARAVPQRQRQDRETDRGSPIGEEIVENDLPTSGPAAETRPIDQYRERTRRFIAAAILVIVIIELVIGAVLVLQFAGKPAWQDGRDYLTIFFPPITTLAATALGFYFGDKR
jgi:hypothetical protein